MLINALAKDIYTSDEFQKIYACLLENEAETILLEQPKNTTLDDMICAPYREPFKT